MLLTAVAALAAAAAHASAGPQALSAEVPLLDVPYLPQSEALCGGAAIAMVMRYWGATGVYAETFAELVEPEVGGIRGRELIRALAERGFEATSFQGDADRVQSALRARRPPVALIEDRPGRFHYVVIVGWRGNRVIVHDPARAPFRMIASDAFVRAWSASSFWTLLTEPQPRAASVTEPGARAGAAASEPRVSSTERRAPGSVCSGMVEEGIRLAGAGDLPGAERVLELAAADCDRDPAPWRELAGVHALRGEWADAARDAQRALDRDAGDRHSTRILATSLFLQGADEPALDAWNRLAVPVVDIVDIRGLERTRFAVAAQALDLSPRTLLTRGQLARGRRRLNALPSVIGSRVTYEPGEDDRAKVTAAVFERPLVPSGLLPVLASGLRAATERSIGIAVASPTGGGELWTGSWRWWERRPRVAIGLAAPSPFGGVWSLEAVAERQTYGSPAAEISERRRGVVFRTSDWISGTTRIEAGAAIDRWTAGSTGTILGGVERVFAAAGATAAVDAGMVMGTRRSALVNVNGEWRSTSARRGSAWNARGGFSAVGAGAPLALWPGAGAGQGRDALLRAHPLLEDGVIRGVFGRRLAHGGAEWRYWRGPLFKSLHVAPAIFVDVARASGVPVYGDRRAHVDAGAGVRVAIPGGGVLRADVARGLRDGRTAMSFGWTR